MRKEYIFNKVRIILIVLGFFMFLNNQSIANDDSVLKFNEKVLNELEARLQVYQKRNDYKNQIEYIMKIAEHWHYIGLYSNEMKCYLKLLKLSEDKNDYNIQSLCYRKIGEIYRALGYHEKALENLYFAYFHYKSHNDINGIAQTYNRIAAVYYELEFNFNKLSFDSTLYYINRSIEISDKSKDSLNLYSSYIILGAVRNVQGDSKIALIYYTMALDIINKLEIKQDKPYILNNYAALYFNKKDYKTAIKYALESDSLAKEMKILTYQYNAARMLAYSYKALKEYQKAYDYIERMLSLNTTIYNQQKSFKILELQQLYEEEKKSLIYKQKERFNYFLIIIASFIFLLILILGIYIFSKNKKLKKSNLLILKQKEDLSKLNATKDKFFSIISHDLRGPISSLQKVLHVMTTDYDNFSREESMQFLELMNKSTKNLYSLLENLLMWSRSQRGLIVSKPDNNNLLQIIENAVSVLKMLADEKKIKVSINIPNDFVIYADVNMLTTIVRNLVSNAIKFTPEYGNITINAELNKTNDNLILLSVADDGIGMTDEIKANIFNTEITTVNYGTKGESGTGLGLVICKELINNMNSSIEIESKLGSGSTFTFTLPKQQTTK